jgi:hypothetical protein
MDLSKIPPVSRRLDYVLQALEDVCKKLDKISDTLVALQEKTLESLGPRPLLNVKQAAAALGVGVHTMRALAGIEITYVKIGRRIAFSPEDLDRFVALNRRDWGSSRWLGKGRRRYGGDEAADQKYLERISRPDPSEKSQSIGVSINRYYQLEAKALSAMVMALEPLPRGRRTSPAALVERLEKENARLVREASRYQALLRASQKALGLAPAPKTEGDSKGTAGGKKARRPRTRAKALIEKLSTPAPSEPVAMAAGGTS